MWNQGWRNISTATINRLSQSTFPEAAPQNGGAANPSAGWRLPARLQKTNKHLPQDGLAVSMGVGCLYSTAPVHIQQSSAATLCAAAHVHPRRVKEWERWGEREREREREREGGREEWEEGRIEILLLTERNQWYTIVTQCWMHSEPCTGWATLSCHRGGGCACGENPNKFSSVY